MVPPADLTVNGVRDSVERLLRDPAPARVTQGLRDRLAERPEPSDVAHTLAAAIPSALPVNA